MFGENPAGKYQDAQAEGGNQSPVIIIN